MTATMAEEKSGRATLERPRPWPTLEGGSTVENRTGTVPDRKPHDDGRVAEPVLSRIMRRVIVSDRGCWEWTGTRVTGGYGRMLVGSRRDQTRRTVLVHRAAWEAVNGPIPAGLTIDHIVCDNPPCCNPDHLVPATMRANTLRSVKAVTAINARKVECGKCFGPLTPMKRGGRGCRPCRLAYYTEYNAKRYGATR